MKEPEDVVVAVIAAAPNRRLTSRVRLQKTVYLLDRLGFESGYEFDYHHYGPYSRALDNTVADAKALKLIVERIEHRLRDGASYSAFETKRSAEPEAYGRLGRERAGELIALFTETNVTVLELAATIDWLWQTEKRTDWDSEVKARKGVKTEGGRFDKAVDFLASLGLNPPKPGSATAA